MSGRDFYVAQDIIAKALAGGGFTYYDWKYPFSEKVVPKVAYAEYDNHWDWIIVASIYMEDYNRGANRILTVLAYTAIPITVFAIIMIWWLSRHVSGPIETIARTMDAFSIAGDGYPTVTLKHKNEIGLLASSFNRMAQALTEESQRRTAAEQSLQALNDALEARVQQRTEELLEINRKLTATEKMAALSQLVFGIAYEMNTPLGNAITIGSYLDSLMLAIKSSQSISDVNTSGVNNFDATCLEMGEGIKLLNKSLGVASHMVESFKQVAPTLQSMIASQVNLKHLLDLMTISMAEDLRRHGVRLTVDCPAELAIETYSEDLLQVVSQLISNSITHGFRDAKDGNISIQVLRQNGRVILIYSDNGVGITEETLNHLFEPFYTTTRAHGSLGLGLFVLYNTVTQKLKGDVLVRSQPSGKGFYLEISLPAALSQSTTQ